MENDFIKIFILSYYNINNILSQANISQYLDTKTNSFLSKLVTEFPDCDIKVLQAMCFAIFYTIAHNVVYQKI